MSLVYPNAVENSKVEIIKSNLGELTEYKAVNEQEKNECILLVAKTKFFPFPLAAAK